MSSKSGTAKHTVTVVISGTLLPPLLISIYLAFCVGEICVGEEKEDENKRKCIYRMEFAFKEKLDPKSVFTWVFRGSYSSVC